jgi:2-haloacid dehalogenase/putative hydrolase of the HAD superfamily
MTSDRATGGPEANGFDVAKRGGGPSAVLFDVGNVIVKWDPRTLYSKIFPDEKERDWFLNEVCTSEWHIRVDTGLSFADNIAALQLRFPDYSDAIAAWWDRWPEMFSGVIPETVQAIEALHENNVPVFALTNMSREAWPGVLKMDPVFELFRDCIVSGVEGVKKPDRAIFDIVCRRANLDASDFLFVDDHGPNIEAARVLGFHVHYFVNPAELRPALEASGLLSPDLGVGVP